MHRPYLYGRDYLHVILTPPSVLQIRILITRISRCKKNAKYVYYAEYGGLFRIYGPTTQA